MNELEQTRYCEKCESMQPMYFSKNFVIMGCRHKPYKGKWVAEIDKSPREDFTSGAGGLTMTNADKIRGMTDEELADWIMLHVDPCALCAYRKRGSCGAPQNKGCGTGRLEWLKQEVDND